MASWPAVTSVGELRRRVTLLGTHTGGLSRDGSGDGAGVGLVRGRHAKACDGSRPGTGTVTALRLLTDLTPWEKQRASGLIRTGYRRTSESAWECLRSWTYLHNESVNIWSHLIGAVIFLLLPAHVFTTELPPRYAVATGTDMVVCSAYFLGVAVCFILSTIFHTFACHSPTVYDRGITLDFQGVLILMWGATVPLCYYTFLDRPRLQTAYLLGTTLLAGLCSVAVSRHPAMGATHLGQHRAELFSAFGLSSFVLPIVHGALLDGMDVQRARCGLGWVLGTAGFNALGMAAYSFKVPERWFHTTFDIFGASHQIMHIMVLFAAFTCSKFVLASFDYRHSHVAP